MGFPIRYFFQIAIFNSVNYNESIFQKAVIPMELKEIYFAAGCFWGTERLFQSIRGVMDTECGFANGKREISSPTYQQVCTGDTDCRETVYVRYDPSQVTLKQLLKAYFRVVDPTLLNRQGNDVGTQYQAGIYYADDASRDIILAFCEREAAKYPVFTVEVCPLSRFCPAEEYHQNYLLKNPGGYCHISPALFGSIDEFIRREP